jgi:hypothetical protein
MLASLSLCLSGCQAVNAVVDLFQEKRVPERYILAKGFSGYAMIEWGVPGAPPVPVEDGFHVIRIPACGYIAFSTGIDFGWASDEYFRESEAGKLERIDMSLDAPRVIHQSLAVPANPKQGDRSFYKLYYLGPPAPPEKERKIPEDFPRGQPCE